MYDIWVGFPCPDQEMKVKVFTFESPLYEEPKHPEHGGDAIKYSKDMHWKGGCNHELADKDEEFPSLDDQSTGLTFRQRITPNKKVFP